MPPESSAGERSLKRGRYAIDRIRLFDHRHVRELGGGRIDVTASRENERDLLRAQSLRDGPDALALQIDVENGDVEAALVGLGQCIAYGFSCLADRMAERFEEILEHHRDERLVLNDQDAALPHAVTDKGSLRARKAPFC